MNLRLLSPRRRRFSEVCTTIDGAAVSAGNGISWNNQAGGVLDLQSAGLWVYTGAGGPPVSAVVTSAAEAARMAEVHWQLSGRSGLLLGRAPADGLDLEAIVAQAVRTVADQGISGQGVTPAVLALVEELSDGRSVQVNQQLIADNAALAAEVAVAHARAASAASG